MERDVERKKYGERERWREMERDGERVEREKKDGERWRETERDGERE